MKRYLAFLGNIYYPNGGMDDFIGDFDTQEEAIVEINRKWRSYSWGHVYDTVKREIVWSE